MSVENWRNNVSLFACLRQSGHTESHLRPQVQKYNIFENIDLILISRPQSLVETQKWKSAPFDKAFFKSVNLAEEFVSLFWFLYSTMFLCFSASSSLSTIKHIIPVCLPDSLCICLDFYFGFLFCFIALIKVSMNPFLLSTISKKIFSLAMISRKLPPMYERTFSHPLVKVLFLFSRLVCAHVCCLI